MVLLPPPTLAIFLVTFLHEVFVHGTKHKLGPSCSSTANCTAILPNSGCIGGRCHCQIGYLVTLTSNGTTSCRAIVCQEDDDCKTGRTDETAYELECSKHVCTCKSNQTTMDGVECTPSGIGASIAVLISVLLVFVLVGAFAWWYLLLDETLEPSPKQEPKSSQISPKGLKQKEKSSSSKLKNKSRAMESNVAGSIKCPR